ncbi:hypothetical protein M0802_009032 [Mischocyttarus mexicanus]|nr:hypothetical protein M0802_009032 [Mischocyttarus mexicanus]
MFASGRINDRNATTMITVIQCALQTQNRPLEMFYGLASLAPPPTPTPPPHHTTMDTDVPFYLVVRHETTLVAPSCR